MAQQGSQHLDQQQEQALRDALRHTRVSFPATLERDYLRHAHNRAAELVQRSVYLLLFLYLLVVIPVLVFVDSPEMASWRSYGLYPIAVALIALWLGTRLSWLKPHIIGVMLFAVTLSLTGTLLGALRHSGNVAGQFCAYESIYVLIIAFSILRLPPRQALASCMAALVLALGGSLIRGLVIDWLGLLLFFGVPLIICTLNGYILDISARRNFANTLLLREESQRLKRWRQQAEKDHQRQQQLNHFMESIAGNLTPGQLLERVLGYLVDQAGMTVGAGYVLENDHLHRQAGWGLNARAREARTRVARNDTLLGGALQQGRVTVQQNIPADYLDMEVGEGRYRPRTLIFWPILDNSQPLGIIEMASASIPSDTTRELLEELHRPLAYALVAALRRQAFIDQAPGNDATEQPVSSL